MKRGISLFLIYLVLSLSLNSIIVFSQVNNPVLREQSILSQCSVDAKSDSDTIKVVLRVTQSNEVMISLYPEVQEGDIGQSQIVTLVQTSDDNIYRFTYQTKEYITNQKILNEICYIDEPDKIGQRASTQEEIVHIDGRCTSASANVPGDPNAVQCSCYIEQHIEDIRVLTHPIYTEQVMEYMGESGRRYDPCPGPKSWDIQIQTTTPETEEPPPPPESPTKCSDLDEASCVNPNDNLNCEWIQEEVPIGLPLECSGGPVGVFNSALKSVLAFLGNILTSFLRAIFFIPNYLFNTGFEFSDFSGPVDCSQTSAWSGGATDLVWHCVEKTKECEDTDRNANYPDGKNYYYPGKLGSEADDCASGTRLKEIYCDENGNPVIASYDCSSEGKICAGPVGEGACYDIDPEDLNRFRGAVEKYQQVIEEIERLAKLRPQGQQETSDIANEIRNVRRTALEIRSYFQDYYNKKPSITLKLEIAKVNALLATYEFRMIPVVVADIIDGNQIKRDYIAAHNGFTEVYSNLIRSNNLDTEQKILISEALTNRAALDLQAGEILIFSNNVDIRDYRPKFEQILSSLASARKYDPSNGRAGEIQSALRISILNTIDDRIDEELKFMIEEPLKRYGIPKLSPEQITSLNGFRTTISQGFLNTLNVFRAYANIDEIDAKIGAAAEKGVLQRTAITYLKTIEERGGDISKLNSLTTRTQRKEYLQGVFQYANQEDIDRIYNTLSLVLYGVQGNGNPVKEDFRNHDLILLSQDGVLSEELRKFYSPDFMFLENKGYIIPEELGGKWYDALLQEVNALNIGLVLIPAATISKGITISQYASKLIGISKIGEKIIAVQRAKIVIGRVNLNPTITLPGKIGKIVQVTLQSIVGGVQKVEVLAAEMGTGVATYLTVAEINPQLAFIVSGVVDFSTPLVDLPSNKANILINKIIEGTPQEISEALIGAGLRKESADILAAKVSREAFKLEQKESIVDLLKKVVNEEGDSLRISQRNREMINDPILKEKIDSRLRLLAERESAKIRTNLDISAISEAAETRAPELRVDKIDDIYRINGKTYKYLERSWMDVTGGQQRPVVDLDTLIDLDAKRTGIPLGLVDDAYKNNFLGTQTITIKGYKSRLDEHIDEFVTSRSLSDDEIKELVLMRGATEGMSVGEIEQKVFKEYYEKELAKIKKGTELSSDLAEILQQKKSDGFVNIYLLRDGTFLYESEVLASKLANEIPNAKMVYVSRDTTNIGLTDASKIIDSFTLVEEAVNGKYKSPEDFYRVFYPKFKSTMEENPEFRDMVEKTYAHLKRTGITDLDKIRVVDTCCLGSLNLFIQGVLKVKEPQITTNTFLLYSKISFFDSGLTTRTYAQGFEFAPRPGDIKFGGFSSTGDPLLKTGLREDKIKGFLDELLVLQKMRSTH